MAIVSKTIDDLPEPARVLPDHDQARNGNPAGDHRGPHRTDAEGVDEVGAHRRPAGGARGPHPDEGQQAAGDGERDGVDRDRQLVGHELTGGEDRLHLATDLRACRDRGAKHVAGRHMGHAVDSGDPRCLRALPGALGAEDEDIERHYLRKPS